MAITSEINENARPVGWGADADRENRPGVPREKRPASPLPGAHWQSPERQPGKAPGNVRADLHQTTPVFGTAQPLKGLSGRLRLQAYKIPDNHPSHWMLLLAADRMDVIESAIADAFRKPSEVPLDPPIARALGWFSLGLGAGQVIAPGAICAMAGVPQRRGLMRLLGLRELWAGVGIFSQQPRPSFPLNARVAGDVMDAALLTLALFSPRSRPGRVLAALGAVLGVTALDTYAARQAGRKQGAARLSKSGALTNMPSRI